MGMATRVHSLGALLTAVQIYFKISYVFSTGIQKPPFFTLQAIPTQVSKISLKC